MERCSYDSDDEFDYADYFLRTFSIQLGNVKKRDINFAMDLVGKVDEMICSIDDGDLSEELLRRHSSLD